MSRESLVSQRRVFILAVTTLLCTGCASIKGVWDSAKTNFDATSNDYKDGTDEDAEAWVKQAGAEARYGQPRDSENDPLKDLLSSPKARSIERNLGYD